MPLLQRTASGVEATAGVVPVEEIETYELEGGAPVVVQDETQEGPWVAQQMLDQLVDLGYIERDESVKVAVLDRARNLGQVYAATGRPVIRSRKVCGFAAVGSLTTPLVCSTWRRASSDQAGTDRGR